MAKTKQTARHNSLGDLVKLFVGGSYDNRCLEEPLQQLVEQEDVTSATGNRWEVQKQPLGNDWQTPLMAPAHTCVVQLPELGVGVLKIARNGNCTLFLRLKKSELHGWADKRSLPRLGRRVFRRTVSAARGADILRCSRAFCLKEGQVHHPHALAILCTMSRACWLVQPDDDAMPKEVGTFTLVGLPPLDSNFEQCLCLMGHSQTFLKDEDDAPLSQRCPVDASVWGKTQYTYMDNDMAARFNRAAREIMDYADPCIFTKCIPALNRSAPLAKQALEKVELLYKATVSAQNGLAQATQALGYLVDAKDSESEHSPLPSPAGVGTPPATSGSVQAMPDSEDEENEAPVAAPAAAPKKEAPKKKAPPPKRAPRAARKSTQDAEDDEDGDERKIAKEDAELNEVVHTEDEEESDDSDPDSEDSDDSDSDEFEPPPKSSTSKKRPAKANAGSDSDSSSVSVAGTPGAAAGAADTTGAKRARRDQADSETELAVARNREERVVTLAAAAARETILDVYKGHAAECCERMQEWMRTHQPTTDEKRMREIGKNVERLHRGDSHVDLMLAALGLVTTLAEMHDDRLATGAVTIDLAEKERMKTVALQATEFSSATLEGLSKAIKTLTDLETSGFKVMQSIAKGGPFAPAGSSGSTSSESAPAP